MKYYAHVFLLIKAIRILLSEDIEDRSLVLADQLLMKFSKLMEQYYGELLYAYNSLDLANCKLIKCFTGEKRIIYELGIFKLHSLFLPYL